MCQCLPRTLGVLLALAAFYGLGLTFSWGILFSFKIPVTQQDKVVTFVLAPLFPPVVMLVAFTVILLLGIYSGLISLWDYFHRVVSQITDLTPGEQATV